MAIHSKKLFIAILTIVSIVSCTNENEEQPSVVLPMEMAYSTGLPVVVINTPDSSSIISKTEWINDAVISIFSPNRQLQFQYITSIKGRGNVTWNRYPKKPYSLKLDRKRGLLGMEAAKRWVLLANWCDRTLLRNDVAFEIARRTSLEWTPHGTHVELILNNTYQGSYYLCEKIQVGKNRLNIKEIHEDNKEEDITGGYLMEIDSYFDETNKFRSKVYGLPFQFQSPDADVLTKDAFEYMEHYVNQLELQLADDNKLKNCSFNEWIDLQSFVDWWIINELCYNKDVCKPRSAYLYKDRGKSIKAGPVWDFDFATFTLKRNIYIAKEFPYLERLFQNLEFQEIACKRWTELRPLIQTIPSYIDLMANKLIISAEYNNLMWPIDKKNNGDEKLTYEQAISRMKTSLIIRIETIDNFISSLNN